MAPHRSLRGLSNIALASAIVSLLLGGALIWIGFADLAAARSRVFEQAGPALAASRDLRSALLDQETGLRGYAITRDDRVLRPYRSGERDQAESEEVIRDAFDGSAMSDEVDAQVEQVHNTMELWRAAAADPILAAPISPEASDAIFRAAKDSFDDVRGELFELQGLLQAERDAAVAQLDATTLRLELLVATAVGLIGAVMLGGAWVLRRRVVAPIEELRSAADDVATDRLDQPIEVQGPTEIEQLAARVGEMRDRILSELATVEASRLELDRRAVALARSNADLEQFAYVASHDLQEPLRKVASFCQLLEQRYGDQLDERGRTYIEFAVDGAKRMQALISDLLELSRLGRNTATFEPCDLGAIARAAAADVADQLDGGSINVGLMPTVDGDPTLFRSLFANLVGNAVKYRKPGEPATMTISGVRDGAWWTVTCADRGIGIEPQYRERVFAIFQRLHGRGEFDGTGIGLSLCKKIVEFSGGRIWIDEPDDGIGATIRFTLPATPASPPIPPTGAP